MAREFFVDKGRCQSWKSGIHKTEIVRFVNLIDEFITVSKLVLEVHAPARMAGMHADKSKTI